MTVVKKLESVEKKLLGSAKRLEEVKEQHKLNKQLYKDLKKEVRALKKVAK